MHTRHLVFTHVFFLLLRDPPPFFFFTTSPVFYLPLFVCAPLEERLILKPRWHLQTISSAVSIPLQTVCTHRKRGSSCSGGEPQVFLFDFQDSLFLHSRGWGLGGLRWRGTHPLGGCASRSLCLFIYGQWPIAGAELCHHLGPASCYYWPHTRMHIQTCDTEHVAQTHTPWSGYY